MSRLALLACTMSATVAGCHERDPEIECTSDAICDRFDGGDCTQYEPTGRHWCSYTDLTCASMRRWSDLDVGDGLEGMCMETSIDGGAADATAADASSDSSGDSGTPIEPPITSYQNADLVLGQPDYISSMWNNGGRSASSMYNASSTALAGDWFYVADSLNARVLAYDGLPTTIHQPADHVVGQIDFTSLVEGPTDSLLGLSANLAVCSDGQRLVVSDAEHDRVLIWNAPPVNDGEAADLVLGQLDFTSSEAGDAANRFDGPAACWTDGTRLFIADTDNDRVLMWSQFPATNAEPADLVLGWPAFGLGSSDDTVADPPTTSSMYQPRGVFSDGNRLFVSDYANHRVMVWNEIPTEDGQPADYFLGQENGTSNLVNAGSGGVNAIGLNLPSGIAIAFDSLLIADKGNARIVVFAAVPTSTGEEADAVLGQPSLYATVPAAPATQQNLNSPSGLTVVDDTLWVADTAHRRVLRYSLDPPD